MATAGEGGAADNTSSYGGGGAGGKFRKKPLRRQTTPYDRPPTALRASNTDNYSNNSWLTKLVVKPASKLISYGAGRLFGSVFGRSPPPLPQTPEVNADVNDGNQVTDVDGQDVAQESGGGDCRQPINSFSSNVVFELEQLLKQKTFTRSEIVHLTELLQSRAFEVSVEGANKKNEVNASDFGRQQELGSGLLEGDRNGGIGSSAVVSTPVQNSNVVEDDIASPAELAKAYMGSRPSKVSPSVLGMRSQRPREDAGLLSSMPFASKSPITSLTKKISGSLAAPENGFTTPRSRSRSAVYNMARTPYSRVHPTSILKGSGTNNNDYVRPSASTSLALVEKNEKFESQPVTLKRRSSVLDDEDGSVGPIRRIRQKSNLLGPRFRHTVHGVGIDNHSKQKTELIGEQRNKASKHIVENENESLPNTSYARVPSKSSEVAARILQHLEKLSPKEKPSGSKLIVARDKSPLSMTQSMLSGRALRNTEDVGSSKLLLDAQDDHRLGDRANAILPDAANSSPTKQGETEESNPKASVVPCGSWNSVLNADSAVTLRASMPKIGPADSVLMNGTSQPQKKRAFRMSAKEDSMEQDDAECNGLASRPSSENKGPMGLPHTDSKLAPAEEHKLVKTTTVPDYASPSGFISRRTSAPSSGAIRIGEGTIAVAGRTSDETKATSQSKAFASTFDKPKEADNTPLFSLGSKVADKFPSLPAESIKRAEPELGSPSRLVNMEASVGSEAKAPGSQLNIRKQGDINGRCDDVPSTASNDPLFSSSPVSYPTNQISTGSAPLFTSSTSITNFTSAGTSASTTSSGSIFGLDAKPSSLGGPVFKFGSSVDPSIAVSTAPTAGISEVADQRTKAEISPSSGSSSSPISTIATANSGSSILGLGSLVSSSTGNNLPGSLFVNASKSLVSGAGAFLQGSSCQLFSSSPVPAFNANGSTSLGSSPSPTFGFSSPASSSGPTSLASVSGPTSSLFKFGASPTAVSEGSSASSTASASPGIFSFGLSTSSSSTTAVGSSSGAALSIFKLGGASSAPTSEINPVNSFSSGISGTFNFGVSSSAFSSSSSAPSTAFGSSWEAPKLPVFGSAFTSPCTGFAFGTQSTSSDSTNAAPPTVFGSSTVASSSSAFSFTSSASNTHPLFGNPSMSGGFAAPPGNNDQMNAEDSMAEDPAPSPAPAPVFGQPSPSPSAPASFGFGSTVLSQTNPFVFGGQQNQVAPQSSSPFQATGSLEFNAGGSFSLGSGGGDKSGRKIVKINRNKNRKK